MSCEGCECQQAIEERSRDYYDGVMDATKHAIEALESAYGYKYEDIPRPVIAVLGTFTDLLDDLDSRRRVRFRRDVYAKVLSAREIEQIKFTGEA